MQTFTGRQYLAIDIANNFGLDKKTWDQRLSWFEDNQDNLMELLPKADEPALFYAGVKAYYDVLHGKPIGYPISLDATSSGFQLLSVLTCDRQAARLCNVINQLDEAGEVVRADAYTLIYEAMLEILGEESKIARDDVKQAIMTALYGSQAVPKEIFGKGELLAIFYNVMKSFAPGAWELNEAFVLLWDSEALTNDWTLPDNFHVHVKVMQLATEVVNFYNEPFDTTRQVNAPTKEGRSLGANTVHSIDGMIVREMTRRCDYDPKRIAEVIRILENEETSLPITAKADTKMVTILWDHYQKSGYLSARILDHLHSENITEEMIGPVWSILGSLPKKPFKLMTIHDCFRCLPQYGNDLREQYNIQLHLIARSNLLSFLLTQITGRKMEIEKLDPTMIPEILKANYALS